MLFVHCIEYPVTTDGSCQPPQITRRIRRRTLFASVSPSSHRTLHALSLHLCRGQRARQITRNGRVALGYGFLLLSTLWAFQFCNGFDVTVQIQSSKPSLKLYRIKPALDFLDYSSIPPQCSEIARPPPFWSRPTADVAF